MTTYRVATDWSHLDPAEAQRMEEWGAWPGHTLLTPSGEELAVADPSDSPEDLMWGRCFSPVVDELNRLHRKVMELEEELRRSTSPLPTWW